jgi:hypothetical protein
MHGAAIYQLSIEKITVSLGTTTPSLIHAFRYVNLRTDEQEQEVDKGYQGWSSISHATRL